MTEQKATNITWHEHNVSSDDLEKLHGHKGATIWFTGLSASGKSTVANAVASALHGMKASTFVLDGDNIRHGLNKNLGFSAADREENIRRIGEVAKLFTQAGIINLTAFISPYIADRDRNREIQEPRDFIEVYVNCPLEVCEQRDPRGLYAKARAGLVPEFTGISAPYEAPLHPEIELHTGRETEEESANRVVEYLERNGYLDGV